MSASTARNSSARKREEARAYINPVLTDEHGSEEGEEGCLSLPDIRIKVNRFKTLRVEGDTLPEYGAAVTRDGEEVGVLTSPALSPKLGNIGLAILRTDAADDGSAVDVALGDGTVRATVDVAALYDPQKRRPRS